MYWNTELKYQINFQKVVKCSINMRKSVLFGKFICVQCLNARLSNRHKALFQKIYFFTLLQGIFFYPTLRYRYPRRRAAVDPASSQYWRTGSSQVHRAALWSLHGFQSNMKDTMSSKIKNKSCRFHYHEKDFIITKRLWL